MSDYWKYVPLKALSANFVLDESYLKSDLGAIDQNCSLRLSAQMLCLIFNQSQSAFVQEQRRILSRLANDKLIDASSLRKLGRYLDTHPNSAIFHRPGIMEFVRWCCRYAHTRATTVRTEMHVFVRALVACSEAYGNREITPTFKGIDLPDHCKWVPMQARTSLWGGHFIEILPTLGRTALLLDHLFRNSSLDSAKERFAEHYGFSLDNWLICHLAVFVHLLQHSEAAKTSNTMKGLFVFATRQIFSAAPDYKDVFDLFIAAVGQSPTELNNCFGDIPFTLHDNLSFRKLRSKPLLLIGEDEFVVLDPRLFLENMCAGPVFALGLHKEFGLACEAHAYDLISAVNDNAPVHCETAKEPKAEPRPLNDILAYEDRTLVLFEVKAAWLNDDIILCGDPKNAWQEILKKYYDSGKKAKGIQQLFQVIRDLGDRALKPQPDIDFVLQTTEVVPILLTYDPLIGDPIIARALAHEFNRLFGYEGLSQTGKFTYGRLSVHNLIVFDLYDLEVLNAAKLNQSVVSVLKQFSSDVPLRNGSLNQFLRRNVADWYASEEQVVRGKTMELLDEIRIKCFGR